MSRDEGLLLDMLIAARMLQRFCDGVGLQRFESDDMLQSAVRYQEQVLGEAANAVSPEFRRQHREIPWERLIALRHWLVHGYRDLDTRRIWRLVEKDVPSIVEALEVLVPPDESSEEGK